MNLYKNKTVIVNPSKNLLKTKSRNIITIQKQNKNIVLKKNSLKKVGHNSGPAQKQNWNCETIKELIKNQKQKYNHNLKID